ncbi:MAG: hypothetical protein FWE11_00115 [Defluviitaleaceae bacterium]|nr:hypothetical protein [Defluviitaleaceae bacterium]
MKNIKRPKLIIVGLITFTLCTSIMVISLISLSLYRSRVEDDYIVRQYLAEHIEGDFSIWLVGSSRQDSTTRKYIFQVGAEDTLEIIIRNGEIESSNWLRRVPHMWSGSDFRFNRNERWR